MSALDFTGGSAGSTGPTGPAGVTGATGAAGSGSVAITQTAHGLAVGDVVRLSAANTYVKAQADSASNAEAVGMITAVADVDNFTLITNGLVTGLSGLTAARVYFLSPSSAGAITLTEPTTIGEVSKPLFWSRSTTSGYFIDMRGTTIEAATTHASAHADGGADEITTGLDPRAYPGAGMWKPRSGRYYGSLGAQSNAGTTLNRVTLVPIWFPTTVTLDRIGVRVVTFASTAVCRLGIYDDTGDGYPGALILDAGTIDGSTNGSKEITISQSISPGVKWLAAAIQVASATYMGMGQQGHFFIGFGGLNSATQFPGAYFQDSVSGALPDPYVGITDNNASTGIRVVVRVT